MLKIKGLISICLVLIILFSTLGITGCGSEPQSTYLEAQIIARTEIWQDINSGKASSATVAILDNGEIVYAEGFGMADRGKSIPVDTSTLFNIGSISKTYCAAAVMALVDDGKVKLDDPVVKYIPDFTMADPRYNDITVRMLLNHTSGIPGTTGANNLGYEYNPTIYEDTLANLSRSHLKHTPGAEAPYCNDGFTLAEILITRVSGQKYIDFLSENIFKPLSLSHTGLSVGELSGQTAATFYQVDDGKGVPLEVLSVVGAGGLSATATDLVRFADSFSGKGKQILSQSSIAEMTKASPSPFAVQAVKETGQNPEMAYGLGLDIAGLPDYQAKGIQVIGKGGDTIDYHSMLLSAPQQRISVSVIEAGHGASAMKIATDIFDAVLQQKGLLEKVEPVVSRPPEPQTIPASYSAFAGYYNSGIKLSFDMEKNNCTVAILVNGKETESNSLSYRDGYFYSPTGSKYLLLSVDGQDCLAASLPGLGINMIMWQKVPVLNQPLSLKTDINAMQWLRRNVKPIELINQTYIVTSATIDELAGYIVFGGFLKIESPYFAGMPSAAVRDQTELTLIDKDGQTWAQLSDVLYSPASTAAVLKIGDNITTISSTGYNEWLKTEEDVILSFSKQAKGRVIVFSSDGSATYDSVMKTGDVYVPKDSFVMLAGMPGDSFTVTARATP